MAKNRINFSENLTLRDNKVGVGTTNPPSTLSVVGNTYVSGSVGIGTTNPQQKLDIQGGNGFIRIGEVYPGYNGITLNNGTSSSYYNILSSPADSSLYLNRPGFGGAAIRFQYGNNTQMSLNSTGALVINNGVTATGTASQALQVNSGAYFNGSVGIGTTNPTSNLHIIGNINSSGIITAASYIGDGSQLTGVVVSSSANITGVTTISVNSPNDALRVTQSGSGNALVIEDSTNPDNTPFVINTIGSVGIGTTNPTRKLHIFGDASSSQFNAALSVNSTNTTGYGAYLGINATSVTSGRDYRLVSAGTSDTAGVGNFSIYDMTTNSDRLVVTGVGSVGIGTTNPLQLLQVGVAGSNTFVVTSSGSVGIGTTNPSRRVQVFGDATTNRFNAGISINTLNTSGFGAYHGFNASSISGGRDYRIISTGTSDTSGVGKLSIFDATANIDRFIVDSSGNIGIGTTSPSYTLDVNGTARIGIASAAILIGNDSGRSIEIGTGTTTLDCYLDLHGADGIYPDYAARLLRTTGANSTFNIINRGAGPLQLTAQDAGTIDFYTSNAFRGRIDSLGNFLVGTATSTGTASQLLQVNGGAYISGNLGVGVTNPSYKLHINGSISLTSSTDYFYTNRINKLDQTSPLETYVAYNGIDPTITWYGGAGSKLVYNTNTLSLYPSISSGLDFGLSSNLWRYAYIDGPIFVGSGTSTGTASQKLQVTGGAYVSGNLGVGVTNPSSKLTVVGTGDSIAGSSTLKVTNSSYNANDGSGPHYGVYVGQSGARYHLNYGIYSEVLDTAGLFNGGTVDELTTVRGIGVYGYSPTSTQAQQKSIGVYGKADNSDWNYNSVYGVKGLALPAYTGFTNNSSYLYAGYGGHFIAHGKANSIGVYADAYLDASPGAGQVAIPLLVASNGTELMRVSNSGNLLVGSANSTGTASQPLQVSGGAYISDKIGIGVTNPGNKLVVGGETAQYPQSLQVLSTLHSTSRRASIGLGGTTGSQVPDWQILVDTQGSGGKDFSFYSTSLNSNVFTIQASGNSSFANYPVLIGTGNSTGTASQRLQVTGGAYVSVNFGVGVTNPASNTQVAIAGTLGISEVGGSGARSLLFSNSSGFTLNHNDNSNITFQALGTNILAYQYTPNIWTIPSGVPLLIGTGNSTGTASQPLQVNGGAAFYGTGSNVGIGTTNPTSKLQVQGDVLVSGIVTATRFIGDGSQLTGVVVSSSANITGVTTISVNSSNNALRVTQSGSGNALVVEDDTNPDTTPFVINTIGSVGIGTTNPTDTLDVRGNALVSGTVNYITVGRSGGNVSSNTATGYNALTSNTTGVNNTATGYNTLYSNTTGNNNTGAGTSALYSNTTGYYNTATGTNALQNNTTGYQNTAIGFQALLSNTNGTSNTATGVSALTSNTTGVSNTATGVNALQFNTIGTNNTAIGVSALQANTTGINNTATGYQALLNNTTGISNTATGLGALQANTTGYFNTANGVSALSSNTTGINNTATGAGALYSNTTGTNNTANGSNALYSNTTGIYNTATGAGALQANTTGINNTANGYNALYNNTTGTSNTATGYLALLVNTTGTSNTATGYNALQANTTGTNNTATGYQALASNTIGYQNTATGYQALFNNTTSSGVTANGFQALFANTTGTSNTATGYQALSNNTTGNYNTATGGNALLFNTVGVNNTATGYQALALNTTGTNNTATGYLALYSNTTGTYNTANGTSALAGNTTGISNTATGHNALAGNTTGTSNTATGLQALYNNTTGVNNTANGASALQNNTTGTSNTATGVSALVANTIGSFNTANGTSALQNNTTGINNTATGVQALQANTTGTNNTANGLNALYSNTTGSYNTATGYSALTLNTTGSNNTGAGTSALYNNTTGVNNTAIGVNAGLANTTGSDNVFLGYNAAGAGTTFSNQIVIGSNVTGQTGSNYVTIGSGVGKIYNNFTANATWTQTSDERLKTNIKPDKLGLSFINRLNPVTYQWKPSYDVPKDLPYYNEVNQRDTETVMHGLIAQEVKEALEVEGILTFKGWDVGPDTIQSISREMFITPIIKSIQELSQQLQNLSKQVQDIQNIIDQINK